MANTFYYNGDKLLDSAGKLGTYYVNNWSHIGLFVASFIAYIPFVGSVIGFLLLITCIFIFFNFNKHLKYWEHNGSTIEVRQKVALIKRNRLWLVISCLNILGALSAHLVLLVLFLVNSSAQY